LAKGKEETEGEGPKLRESWEHSHRGKRKRERLEMQKGEVARGWERTKASQLWKKKNNPRPFRGKKGHSPFILTGKMWTTKGKGGEHLEPPWSVELCLIREEKTRLKWGWGEKSGPISACEGKVGISGNQTLFDLALTEGEEIP